jgi:hypothetical protein
MSGVLRRQRSGVSKFKFNPGKKLVRTRLNRRAGPGGAGLSFYLQDRHKQKDHSPF